MIERGAQFAGRGGAIASLGKSHSQVEMIVRVAGIVLNRSLEIFGCFFLAAAGGGNSEVVGYLGQRQEGGEELESGFGCLEICLDRRGEGLRTNCAAGGR